VNRFLGNENMPLLFQLALLLAYNNSNFGLEKYSLIVNKTVIEKKGYGSNENVLKLII